MATETLSQNDIDRLLVGGVRMTPTSSASRDVHVYDWRRPPRVSKERQRTVEAMYERLAKGLETWIGSRMRGQADVRLQSVEQFSFGEFALSLPLPCTSFLFDIGSTGQKGVIDIGPELSTYMVDRLFGGQGVGGAITRTLTPIERMAVRSLADRIAGLLQDIWQDHVPMECTITGFESSPEMLQIANRDDPVLVANVEFSSGTMSSLAMICLPFSVLDDFFAANGQARIALPSGNEAERDVARQRSEQALRATRVSLTARLPDFQLSMRELALLQVGSVMPTSIPKDARVVVRAGSQEKFIGSAGRVAGHLAIRIADAVPSTAPSPDSRTSV